MLDHPVSARAEPLRSSPEDTIIKCTGGTTGRPTAVRWRTADIARNLNAHNPWLRRDVERSHAAPSNAVIPVADARLVLASPLMHGSGQTRALGALCAGGTVITLPRLAPSTVWETLARHRADTLAIVGDAMARPLADALDRHPNRWDLSGLWTITSSGAAWSAEVKEQLLARLPLVRLVETLGATEATGLGSSTAIRGRVPPTGTFALGAQAACPACSPASRAAATAWPASRSTVITRRAQPCSPASAKARTALQCRIRWAAHCCTPARVASNCFQPL
jgi:acyl-CoA synthetase (AMP-forming)/AMP-acid ligase II